MKMFRKPLCRYCGREWMPPRNVSASASYCDECLEERIAIVAARVDRIVRIERGGEVCFVSVAKDGRML